MSVCVAKHIAGICGLDAYCKVAKRHLPSLKFKMED
jgi:hypothetical protein